MVRDILEQPHKFDFMITVNARNGRNCLHQAILSKDKDTVTTIIDYFTQNGGSQMNQFINMKNDREDGLTALHYAC